MFVGRAYVREWLVHTLAFVPLDHHHQTNQLNNVYGNWQARQGSRTNPAKVSMTMRLKCVAHLTLFSRIEEGDYYEAHQATRTIVARYVRTKQYDEAVKILAHTAELLAKAKESSSACDLILYLIDVYHKAGTAPTSAAKGALVQLVNQLDAGKEPLVRKIAQEAIQWSIAADATGDVNTRVGDAELHHVFGSKFAKESPKETYEAEKHLLLGTRESPAVLAAMLYSWATGPGTDIDAQNSKELVVETPEDVASALPLYLSRGVLGYLSAGNVRDARAVLHAFLGYAVAEHASGSAVGRLLGYDEEKSSDGAVIYVFHEVPLLNFLQLLVPTVQSKSPEMYNRLRARYAQIIDGLDAWKAVLATIAQKFCGIAPPRPQGNMLQDLLGSFMGGAGGPRGITN